MKQNILNQAKISSLSDEQPSEKNVKEVQKLKKRMEKEAEQENSQIGMKQKEQFVKKNYIDPTAGFFYILGCSLVHFSLFIGQYFVLWPIVSEGKRLDAEFVA